jgi:selenocysteine lyase/cysteine desulfurase
VFISPHKFIGGPGTPGVLVAKRGLFATACRRAGRRHGGVGEPEEHRYLRDPEQREEGGTPAIIESIRAGLVFQLKEAVGAAAIRAREEEFIRRRSPRGAQRTCGCSATSSSTACRSCRS